MRRLLIESFHVYMKCSPFQFGHALGLKDSPVKNSVMYSRYIYPLPQKLHEDDIKGIQFLYGSCDDSYNGKPIEIVTLQQLSTTTSKPMTSFMIMHSTSATPSTTITTRMNSKLMTHATMTTSTAKTTATQPNTVVSTSTTTSTTPKTNPTTATTPFEKTTFPIITTMATTSASRSFYNPLQLEMLRKEANGDMKTIVITPDGIEYNGGKMNGDSDSIVFKRNSNIDHKHRLISGGSPMIVCIWSSCQF